MRRIALAIAPLLIASAAEASEADRTINFTRPATGVTAVVLEAGVGDVEITADESASITAFVELSGKKHFWSSERARRAIEEVELSSDLKGGRLSLHLSHAGDGEDRDFGEDWTIHIPHGVAVEIQLGVGDVRVLDIAADTDIEVGVGDVRVEGEHAAFGRLRAECGVGDATLRTPEGREEGHGFIAHSLTSRGPGRAELNAKAGVGDVEIRLH